MSSMVAVGGSGTGMVGMGSGGGGVGGMGGGGGGVGGVSSAAASVVAGVADPSALFGAGTPQYLASAFGTIGGDAEFWEENISPATIRSSLSSSDPSNPNATPELLRGMKWLLASISKGRDVSDFYPHVVKLVGAISLEVRKMVYMFLVQYADHDSTTRELSLLSINSFQRGLADTEQLIRALALRVLTSIRIPDILQIQILGVQKCAKDHSPYVRKCAANALAKLHPRCGADATEQQEMLLEIMKTLIDQDTSTMVLSSAVVAFTELCPERLELLHGGYRKLCHLLTDMDEWGQVVTIDTLARYCRRFFKEPYGWKHGTAEKIDRQRRVRRIVTGIQPQEEQQEQQQDVGDALDAITGTTTTTQPTDQNTKIKFNNYAAPKKIKRRVVRKGFYSDEEDDSSEEEVYANTPIGPPISLANAMRQPIATTSTTTTSTFKDNVHDASMGGGGGGFSDNVMAAVDNHNNMNTPQSILGVGDEDEDLAEDHKLLLKSSMPLLKSRNAGVVCSVCSLQYYCGVSSVTVRAGIGKALVRIHRDRREIQYVVLSSIRTLCHECPSAFGPFLQDFFIKAMDPPFTKKIKLDILTSLALEPKAIDAVLRELRTYILHMNGDPVFVTAAIKAVGKIVELARIVHDRHGATASGNASKERKEANRIALNCLSGLVTLSSSSKTTTTTSSTNSQSKSDNSSSPPMVIGECVIVMQQILLQLMSDVATGGGLEATVEDPHRVQERALRRIMLLLLRSLSSRTHHKKQKHHDNEDDFDDEEEELNNGSDGNGSKRNDFHNMTIDTLPPKSVATALWIIGEWLTTTAASSSDNNTKYPKLIHHKNSKKEQTALSKMRYEIIRLVCQIFPGTKLDPLEKEQAVHLASKLWLFSSSSANQTTNDHRIPQLCEMILSMGRLDVNVDVRDRARMESNLLHGAIGLKHDTDAMEAKPMSISTISTDKVRGIFLKSKPSCSYLPLEDDNNNNNNNENSSGGEDGSLFRFGTLSSIVGHRARNAYLSLPPWANKDSDESLRDPAQNNNEGNITNAATNFKDGGANKTGGGGFYESDGSSSSSTSAGSSKSSSSSSSSDDKGDDDDSSSSSSSSSSGDDSSSDDDNDANNNLLGLMNPSTTTAATNVMQQQPQTNIPPMMMNNMMMMNPNNTNSLDIFGSATAPVAVTTNQQQQQLVGFPETVSSSSTSSSDEDSSNDGDVSSSDDSDDDSDDGQPAITMPSGVGVGGGDATLIPMMAGGGAGGGLLQQQQPSSFMQNQRSNNIMGGGTMTASGLGGGGDLLTNNNTTTSSSSMMDDFKGMVLAPVVTNKEDSDDEVLGGATKNNKHNKQIMDAGAWIELVKPQHSGGLSVKARYLRGDTKSRELQLLGMQIDKPSTVCLEVQLENTRSDGQVLRRLRILKHSSSQSSSSSTIGPKSVKLPMEITALSRGQKCNVKLAVDFVSPSDRDGISVARLDMKFSGGSIPIEIKPTLGEFLQPCPSIVKPNDFDKRLKSMSGFERVTSTFASNTIREGHDLARKVQERTALTCLRKPKEDSNTLVQRLVGSLPASGEPVLVMCNFQANNRQGNIVVCCNNTLASTSMLGLIKRSLTE